MATATIRENRALIAGFGYENRTWAKKGHTLKFNADGIAEIRADIASDLDLHHHPEFQVVDIVERDFEVRCDRQEDLVLETNQRVVNFVEDDAEETEPAVDVEPSEPVVEPTEPAGDPDGDENPEPVAGV